ncbi:hypothetical protein BD408DRAFT_455703 [Parasitella parasitica]|nr:hypothetical protein BD408DRAFT_455703 [Parasitella parasitica]
MNENVSTEGHRKCRIMSSNHKIDYLRRPKLPKAQLKIMKDVVHFGTSFILDNPITVRQYKTNGRNQHEDKSLRSKTSQTFWKMIVIPNLLWTAG